MHQEVRDKKGRLSTEKVECELRINGSLREVWMRARVFESEFQISFLIFSHSDDQNISSACKSWKAHFNKLVQKKWTDLLVLDIGKSKFGPRDGSVLLIYDC